MGSEHSSSARARRLKEPGQRVDHDGLGIASPSENVHTVPVRLVLFLPAVAIRDEYPRDGSELTAPGEDLVEKDHPDVQASAKCLRLCHVAQIIVGELMGQHAPEMLIVRLLEQTPGDIELTPAGAGRVDLRIVHDANANLAQRAWIIHMTHKRGHNTTHTFRLLRIEVVGRGPSAGLWGLRAPGWLSRNPGATRRQEEKQKGDVTECGFQLSDPGRQGSVHPRDWLEP